MKKKNIKLAWLLLAAVLSVTLICSLSFALPASANDNASVLSDNYPSGEGDDYLNEDEYTSPTHIIADILLWLGVSVIGIVIPFALFATGIIVPLTKKFKREKHWLLLSGVSAVWMLTSAAIMLTVIVAMIFGGI